MTAKKRQVTLKGNPLALSGNEINVADKAPDAAVVGADLRPVKLSSLRGGTMVLCTVPSLDTGVCAAETRRFNEEAGKLGDGVVVVVVSMDLPFAQARWCGAEGIDHVKVFSDHRDAAVGKSYGVLIGDLRLLARAVFVIDGEGVVRYRQIVDEVAHEPDYKAALAAVASLR